VESAVFLVAVLVVDFKLAHTLFLALVVAEQSASSGPAQHACSHRLM
jgi:hypothetical protein